jgi:hypothetical protein
LIEKIMFPVVGGITKNMLCKDMADYLEGTDTGSDGTGSLEKEDCEYDSTDPTACSLVKSLLDGEFAATVWSEVESKCTDAFDADAGDFKCVQALFTNGENGSCTAYLTSSTVEFTDALRTSYTWGGVIA